MPQLQPMPQVRIDVGEMQQFGHVWEANGGRLAKTPPYSSLNLGALFDNAVGNALAAFLGNIPIVSPNKNSLLPEQANCVEVGDVRVIGGVRPQNFDVGYRPDGIRFAFDSKTLNDERSVGKNWQNMVNDLATEATTIHSRFPHAIVAFMVIIPFPCVDGSHRKAITETLERLSGRENVNDPAHMAEVISLVLGHPKTGRIDNDYPAPDSTLRIEAFAKLVENIYSIRYKGLPPHDE